MDNEYKNVLMKKTIVLNGNVRDYIVQKLNRREACKYL